MNIVGTAFGNCVYATTCEVSQLYIVGSQLHLNFLNNIKAVRVGTGTCTGSARLAAAAYTTKRVAEADSVVINGAVDGKVVVAEVGTGKRVIIRLRGKAGKIRKASA